MKRPVKYVCKECQNSCQVKMTERSGRPNRCLYSRAEVKPVWKLKESE